MSHNGSLSEKQKSRAPVKGWLNWVISKWSVFFKKTAKGRTRATVSGTKQLGPGWRGHQMHTNTHHIRETRQNHHGNPSRGRTRSVWGCTAYSGTGTLCRRRSCCLLERDTRRYKVRTGKKQQKKNNWVDEMTGYLLQPACTPSSAPSGQSLSPSHFQRWGTQWEPGQWNASGLHVFEPENKRVDKCIGLFTAITS